VTAFRSAGARRRTFRSAASALLVSLLALTSACRQAPPAAKSYPIKGQILAVLPERQSLTIAHGDIAGLMPAMTMTYHVATPTLMAGRAEGEMIEGTLVMRDAGGEITAITHEGSAPLPENANQIAMASGILGAGDSLPDVALVDQHDRRQAVSDWRGKVTLLTFIYTSCPLPDFCPLMDAHFADLQRAIAKDPALAGQVRLASVSFDPDTDTPAVLAAHAAKLHANPDIWTFFTGDRRTIDRFAGKLGVSVVHDADPSSITHSLRTIVVGRDNRIRQVLSGNDWTPEAALAEIRAAVAAG
jgi:protein SCO1/2